MGDAEHGPGLGSIEIVIDPASIEGQQHRDFPRLTIVQGVVSAGALAFPCPIDLDAFLLPAPGLSNAPETLRIRDERRC
jgi:hypothetical protein